MTHRERILLDRENAFVHYRHLVRSTLPDDRTTENSRSAPATSIWPLFCTRGLLARFDVHPMDAGEQLPTWLANNAPRVLLRLTRLPFARWLEEARTALEAAERAFEEPDTPWAERSQSAAERWVLERDAAECALEALRHAARVDRSLRAGVFEASAGLGEADEQALADLWCLSPAAALCRSVLRRAAETGMYLDRRECWWWFQLSEQPQWIEPVPYATLLGSEPLSPERTPLNDTIALSLPIAETTHLAAAHRDASPSPFAGRVHTRLAVRGLPPTVEVEASVTTDARHLALLITDHAGQPNERLSGTLVRLYDEHGAERSTARIDGFEASLPLGALAPSMLERAVLEFAPENEREPSARNRTPRA